MSGERSEGALGSEFDSQSLVQLLQNNQVHKSDDRRKPSVTPLSISVVILYGIVGILVLFLMFSSNQSTQPAKDTMKDYIESKDFAVHSNQIKRLQEDISYLRLQNLHLMDRLQSSSVVHNKSLNTTTNKTSMERPPLLESIYLTNRFENITRELNSSLIQMSHGLNASLTQSELTMETRLFEKLSEKIFHQVWNKTMSQGINGLQGTSKELSSLGDSFVQFQKLIFEILGGPESKVILSSIRNRFLREIRSCSDYRRQGITSNGFYNIDLGNNESIQSLVKVFCNFTSNSTYIYHDKLGPHNITACEGDECFKFNLTYSASNSQIQKLIDSSTHCQQTIQFRCLHAPLNHYGAWYDGKDFKSQVSPNGSTICDCFDSPNGCTGIPSLNKCNCDASSIPLWLQDSITITTGLPISRFTYGHLFPGGQQKASIEIGPLNCTREFSTQYGVHVFAKWSKDNLIVSGFIKTTDGGLQVSVSGYYIVECVQQNRGYRSNQGYACNANFRSGVSIQTIKAGSNIDYSVVSYHGFSIYLLMKT